MKKQLLINCFIGFFLAKAGTAQYDPKAFEILEKMSEKYKHLKNFEAELSYSMVNKAEGINEAFTGNIMVQGDKFHLTLNEQEVINNGKTVWTYTPGTGEVVIDYNNPEEFSPSRFYSIYKKGYKYLYLQNNKTYHVIDLVPEDRNAVFFKIRMNISKKDNSIKNWTFFDRLGNQYKYAIKKFRANQKISDSLFTFDAKKHPGIEIVDLR